MCCVGCPSKPEFRIEAGKWSKPVANAGLPWTREVANAPRAAVRKTQNACSCSRAHTDKSVPGRQVPQCRATRNSVTWTSQFLDERAIEVLVTGLPLFFGAQLAVDFTLWCPQVGWNGTTRSCQGGWNCREDKERNSEFLRADKCRLVVVAKLEDAGMRSPSSALVHSLVPWLPFQRNSASAPWGGQRLCSRFGRSV